MEKPTITVQYIRAVPGSGNPFQKQEVVFNNHGTHLELVSPPPQDGQETIFGIPPQTWPFTQKTVGYLDTQSMQNLGHLDF